MKSQVTVVVLTKDEEANLPSCLDSIATLSDDILILDSGSTDGTLQIAEQRGIPVYTHPFTGFGDQRNWAIDSLPHRHSWVLHLDADERVTPSFACAIEKLLATERIEAGFYVPSKLMLGNSWLRYSSGYPVYQVRLFHLERMRFKNEGHGQREIATGTVGFLTEPYLHYAFSKGLKAWFEKHAKYASDEAMRFEKEKVGLTDVLLRGFSPDPIIRRRSMKQLASKIPFKSTCRFVYQYFLKFGFLDGASGLQYARMMSIYEAMFSVYLSAIRDSQRDIVPSTHFYSNDDKCDPCQSPNSKLD